MMLQLWRFRWLLGLVLVVVGVGGSVYAANGLLAQQNPAPGPNQVAQVEGENGNVDENGNENGNGNGHTMNNQMFQALWNWLGAEDDVEQGDKDTAKQYLIDGDRIYSKMKDDNRRAIADLNNNPLTEQVLRNRQKRPGATESDEGKEEIAGTEKPKEKPAEQEQPAAEEAQPPVGAEE